MRAFLAAAIFCLSFCALSPAHAGWADGYQSPSRQHGYHERGARAQRVAGHRSAVAWDEGNSGIRRTVSRAVYSVLSAQCRLAASLGGPCGCFAGELVSLPHIFRGHNLWLADEWARAFERVAPAAGMAAVWPHRHVAIIVAANGDGTITVHDSWAVHRVSTRGLIIVDPHQPRHRFAGI